MSEFFVSFKRSIKRFFRRLNKLTYIFRFGVVRYLRLLLTERRMVFPHYLSVLAIMKNEGRYLAEWIEYHRLVGVEKFYLYDNESDDDTVAVLTPYIEKGIVEYTYWPGELMQAAAYKGAVRRFRMDTEWLAIIDLDEFLVPIETNTVAEFLKKLPKGTVRFLVEYMVYGGGGHEKEPDGLVIENYKMCMGGVSVQPLSHKAIVNPRHVVSMKIHGPWCIGGSTVHDESGERIRLNHYYTKSWEKFSNRVFRGDSCHGDEYARVNFTRKKFDGISLTARFRDDIMDKYVEPVKAAIRRDRG